VGEIIYIIKTPYAIGCVVKFNNAGVVTRDRSIGSEKVSRSTAWPKTALHHLVALIRMHLGGGLDVGLDGGHGLHGWNGPGRTTAGLKQSN
jgi:hypothetical protein